MMKSRAGTILLCEDDDAVRHITTRILERSGHEVLPATDAASATDVIQARDGGIDLLITDVVMPGRSGPELAKELRRDYPQLKVLFVSGFAAQHPEVVESFGDSAAFLAKPYSSASLTEVTQQLLSE